MPKLKNQALNCSIMYLLTHCCNIKFLLKGVLRHYNCLKHKINFTRCAGFSLSAWVTFDFSVHKAWVGQFLVKSDILNSCVH